MKFGDICSLESVVHDNSTSSSSSKDFFSAPDKSALNADLSGAEKKSVFKADLSGVEKKSFINIDQSGAEKKSVFKADLSGVEKKSVINTDQSGAEKKSVLKTDLSRVAKKSVINTDQFGAEEESVLKTDISRVEKKSLLNTDQSGAEKTSVDNRGAKQVLSMEKMENFQACSPGSSKKSVENIGEKMKSLSELVNKISVGNETVDHPLSPNSNKENIPLKKLGQIRSESKVSTENPGSEISMSKSQESFALILNKPNTSNVSNISLVALANQQNPTTTCGQGTSLAELSKKQLAGKSEKNQMLNQKPSLSELAMKQNPQTQPVKPPMGLTHSVESKTLGKMSCPTPSLAELVMKHESESHTHRSKDGPTDSFRKEETQDHVHKPSLAEIAMKHELQSQSAKSDTIKPNVKKASLDDLIKTHSHSNIEGRLSELGRLNTQNKLERKADIGESKKPAEISDHKASLLELASKFQEQKEKKLPIENEQQQISKGMPKPAISLTQLVKSKNTQTTLKVSKETKTQRKDNLVPDIEKMCISDKSNGSANAEEMNVHVKMAALDDIILDLTDSSLNIAQTCKFNKAASKLGKTLCLNVTLNYKKGSDNIGLKKYRIKRFSYQSQMTGRRANTPLKVRKIIPFDFSEPSPDDIVKRRQKAAFKRSGERKESV